MATKTSERITDHLPARDITLQGLLDALADPVRRSIVRQLAESEHEIVCGAFDIDVTYSTRTHHFKVLRQAGIIEQHYEGTMKMNTLRRSDVDAAAPGLLDAVINAASRDAQRPPAP
ncbi:ArsR/SmtB family transcription factor [Gordonia polyisoprenivorans]|uniref:ArsR/SmtB family transcription factor n=1 Tax=Gordonia polyisoprenivorans TaxID=84595 RepID=UPI001AD7D3CA|nr:helix-turn-helix transcriptional regulator [Gordonia polyisoprenivorans]QTI69764.1 helix-turn-helix transcriptional regulator [Gordonia polyisoprenivorans]